MSMRGPEHPFYSYSHAGNHYYCFGADDRLRRIKTMDCAELLKVLDLPDLQRSVRGAAASRLRRLERQRRQAD
ncbi:MAG: hypothetical protein WBN86_10220 [Porticoccaceae bacterium]|jgi:hypothetical protein